MDYLLDKGEWKLDNLNALRATDVIVGENLKEIVKRHWITPKGYLSQWVLSDSKLTLIDNDYGCGIYQAQSLPITATLIKQIQQDLIDAVNVNPSITETVKILDINFSYLSTNKITINLTYLINGQSQNLSLEV